MSQQRQPRIAASGELPGATAEVSLPHLVGKVFESAPAIERSRLLEHLMRPLGVLSLAVVANGIFSKLRFLGGWPDLHIRPEDAEAIRAEDVVALVDYVQQASSDVMYGLVQLVSESPGMSATAAATVLTAVLLKRFRTRPFDLDSSTL
jgi:di/tricarboxylate transporter